MKTAILGGSFNPIHNGHLYIAEKALENLQVDRVLFVPVGLHHFKETTATPPYEVRLDWVKKAVSYNPKFECSDADAPKYGISYTKRLLIRLQERYPNDQFFFIAGEDILESLPRWHDYPWLMDNVTFAIFNRPNSDFTSMIKSEHQDRIIYFKVDGVDISSTEIRKIITVNNPIKHLVPNCILMGILDYYQHRSMKL